MRQLSFIIAFVLCLLFADQAHAQRQLPGMQGIQVTGGMVDGIYSSKQDNEAGYYFGLAMATYVKNGNKWVFGAEFMERYYPYRETRIPVSQFTAEGGYYLKFLSDPSKTVLFYLGSSALQGMKHRIGGVKRRCMTALPPTQGCFYLWRGAITLELETYLTDRIVLLLSGGASAFCGGVIRQGIFIHSSVSG